MPRHPKPNPTLRAGVDQIPRFLREPLPEIPSHPADWIFYALIGLSVGLSWAAIIIVAFTVSPEQGADALVILP